MTKKVALITGGGRGIGRLTALTLASNGWTIIVAGRNLEAIERVAKEANNDSIAIHCNVMEQDSVKKLFSEIEDKYTRLDLLFNNAGMNVPNSPIDEITLDQWQEIVGSNLSGAFYCTQQAFKLMKKQDPQGGRIINNGSISAHVPRPNSAPYTSTKHGITGLTKSTSLDGRSFNIACGQIDIGNADTSLANDMKIGALQPNGNKLVEPTIDPQIIADSVLFMSNLPLSANVQFMTVMATKMPYIGRG